jgi:hypothetical protein
MQFITNLRKMRTRLEGPKAVYQLPIVDILDYRGLENVNDWVGQRIQISFEHAIHCIETGKKIRKSFGEGLSYEAFLSSPLASPSIVHPELSRIHEGIALRDKEWEEAHHNQPHVVYLSRTSEVKVGVTRTVNVPSRWIDQGASEAIILAETPYRQLAGLIEVTLKDHFADKTAWQKMLKNETDDRTPLPQWKERALNYLPAEFEPFISDSDEVTAIHYPVLAFPKTVKSLKLDTTPDIEGELSGIKGQYLLFSDGRVFNVRSHAGYRVTIRI